MNPPRTSFFRWMPESQLGDDAWHSLLISLLRGLAAIQVAAAHLRAEFFPGLRTLDNPTLWYQGFAFLTGFAHQAVIVFFVISGWLVGGSLLNRLGQPEALKLYAIDRLTRLWTVLIPTFVLIVVLGIAQGVLDPRSVDFSPANAYSLTALAGNLIGLQTISLPEFGGNFPLWSLANEFWYYLMFPLLMLSMSGKPASRRALPALLLVALGALLPADMVLYFSTWLLGAAFSRVRIACGVPTRCLLLAILGAVSVYQRLYGINNDLTRAALGQDLLFSLVFLLFLCSTIEPMDRQRWPVAALHRVATFFANFSFTLYVVHVPVFGLMAYLGTTWWGRRQLDPANLAELGIYLAMLTLVIGFAYGFYRLFEAHTYAVRRWTRNLLLGRLEVSARAAPAKH